MRIFRDTVTGRSARLLKEAVGRFPHVTDFAMDEDAPKHDPSPVKRDYRHALAVSAGDADLIAVDADDARGRLRERADSLRARILGQLDGQCADSWLWGPRGRSSSRVDAYAAFELVNGNCVELMLKWEASRGAYIDVKAYPNKRKPGKPHLYADFDHIPLGLPWSASDDGIVENFLVQVSRVQDLHPRR